MNIHQQTIYAAISAGIQIDDIHQSLTLYVATQEEMERFCAMCIEAGRFAEREECFILKKEAMEIFNFNPLETSQEVRDVIEWFSGAIRARSTK